MQHSQQHFHLDTPQTLALQLAAGDMVHVTQGCIWLTLEGHSRDVWLKVHDTWSLPLRAKVWISSDALAAFTVQQPVQPPKSTGVVKREGLRPPVIPSWPIGSAGPCVPQNG
ncbi:MAG: DUF2917 domain-containing protein [Pseudomonadota bacterium]